MFSDSACDKVEKMLQQKWSKSLIFILAVFSYTRLSYAATIPPIQSIDLSANDVPSANITIVGAIDPDFRVTTNFQDVDVEEDDCVMNVIIAMGILARSFTEAVRPRTFRDERYPGCFILTRSPTRGSMIEARFLVWGLYSGIKPMIQNGNWKLAEFTLLWEGRTVGFISFGTAKTSGPYTLQGSQNSRVQSPRSTTAPPNPLAISSHINSPQGNSSAPNPSFFIDVKPTVYGDPVPKTSVFLAVLECLLYLAPKPTSDALLPLSVHPRPHDVDLRLWSVSRPGSGELFLDYGVAGLGLSTIPSISIAARPQQWAEVGFEYRLNGILVGRGSILKYRR